ncbi:unnamed protein product [Rotaria socialis]|uniref:Uncharacterized protein n=1 Tax=Rotaria socialis TaxID=392032 RepID=A0A817TBB4_9BILA|nr:unnamed protein product [Rotaria socialis]CAF4949546.1 unnamed protein product [Rotaria socialis]
MTSSDTELHLQTLTEFSNNDEQESDSSDSSDIEVTSEIDDHENHIINYDAYFNINSDDNEKDEEINNNATTTASAITTIADDKTSSSSPSDDEIEVKSVSGGIKRKRQQWSVAKKLKVFNQLEKDGNNKSLTA